MTTIYVCIGSACHLKGSYDIINRLQALIAKQELGERVEAVSYTHLDVYKRQLFALAAPVTCMGRAT